MHGENLKLSYCFSWNTI